ncbi:MAG: hypothetical protein M1818_007028 [Claussenomyces sp. TS43310]|nr:MAG: hypothetical protein M1818_007028 [Claussenomyces sp. TS43310]
MNGRSAQQNAGISLYASDAPATFRSTTIAPSPPPSQSTTPSKTMALSPLDIPSSAHPFDNHSLHSTPLSAGLRLQTENIPGYAGPFVVEGNGAQRANEKSCDQSCEVLMRTPSIKLALANSVGSLASAPGSALTSPMLNALSDVSPLPSPLSSSDSPGPWKKFAARQRSREQILPGAADSALVTANGESISQAILNQSKRRAYQILKINANDGVTDLAREKNAKGHERSRSISEYMPEPLQGARPRQHTVSGSHAALNDSTPDSVDDLDVQMRREPHLAAKRGLAPVPQPPTPPSSRTGGESSDSDSSLSHTKSHPPRIEKRARFEYFDACTIGDQKKRRWRALKSLGEGTFSKVLLATSQLTETDGRIDEDDRIGQEPNGMEIEPERQIERKKLVAIKICEHGPKGGASEERVEMSLKRELEIMRSINHPSLVHLKAWSIEETRAILVLSYCPGGDLFDVASQHQELLVPSLLRRLFAELSAAVQYLHERHIVHRDIKLENVLVNIPPHELARDIDWVTYPYSVITLTDLGLSRRVADDEKLTTRCGSDDYAAPEVIMGQPYDGRAVDAWSLGVVLYALLESRLPFDPSPGMSEGHKQRSKTSHRIARVEWCWVQFAGEDGDHEGDAAKFEAAGLLGAMKITEGLLKRARSRWPMAKVAEELWVKEAVHVEEGIKFREEEVPEEV